MSFSKTEIHAIISLLGKTIKTEDFGMNEMEELMRHVEDNRYFNAADYIGTWEREQFAEDWLSELSGDRLDKVMSRFYYVHEDDIPSGYTPSNLNEEQVDELLQQLKDKCDSIQALESFLGESTVAKLRGFPNPNPQPDKTNRDSSCLCGQVVDIDPHEIEACCEYGNMEPAQEQWVGNNGRDWVVLTCSCGKISKPYLKD